MNPRAKLFATGSEGGQRVCVGATCRSESTQTRRSSSSRWPPSWPGCIPQTLRTYDRMGLVVPRRTAKRGRRYSARDIAQLRLIQRLLQDEGINLEGIRRILPMQDEIDDLRARMQELTAAARRGTRRAAGSRVFTADPSGGVHLGGARVRPAPRALPGPRN